MAELDDLLRDTLHRAAVPGDPTGVADAIRARVAAGDPGTPAATSGFGGVRWWMLFLPLLVVVLLATGGTLALGWVPGAPTPTPTPTVADAPAQPIATSTPTRTPTPTPSATPTATADPAPAAPPPADPPAPPADVTPPVVTAIAASPSTVYGANGSDTTISASASDDVGVETVTISWSGVLSGSAVMSPGYSFPFDTPPGTPTGTLTFTVQAIDAAGNVSAPASVTVTVQY